jgi:di/tripeptidase
VIAGLGLPAVGLPRLKTSPAPEPPAVDRTHVTDLFLELTQISGSSRRERQIADAIVAKLSGLGLEAREDGAAAIIGGDTGNLIVNLPGTIADAPGLIFMAHMDTVRAARGVQPVIRDGVIYSDGTTALGADDRAGCAEILEMLRIVGEKKLPHPPIQVIFTVGEEAGLLGSEALRTEDLRGRLGFAVDSFHPNELFWGSDGPLFTGDMRDSIMKAAQREFRRPSVAGDELRPRNNAEGLLLDFTRDGIRAIGMEPVERNLWGASSDAASLRDKGIPAITIGAGEQDIHSTEEHVSIDDLVKSTELLLALVKGATRYRVDEAGAIVPREESIPPTAPPVAADGWLIA